MGKVSTPADLSRELRQALGGKTQAELAALLLVSRNYVSQIEANLKKPSPRLEAQMRRMLTEATDSAHKVSRAEEAPYPSHQPVSEAADTLLQRLESEFQQLREAVGNDLSRLGWVIEELRQLRTRIRWSDPEARRRALADLDELSRRAEEMDRSARSEKGRRHA